MAETKDKDYVVAQVEEHGIRFIRLWFTDILGSLKSFAITTDELEGALDEGMGFDGSSIIGYQTIEESDMIAKPDPSTFAILPWRPKEKGVARVICDVLEPSGKPYEGIPGTSSKEISSEQRRKASHSTSGRNLSISILQTINALISLIPAGTSILPPWIRLLIFGETRYLRYKTWAFVSSIVTTRLALANTRLICATRTL